LEKREKSKMRDVLITGGAGFIGSNLAHKLQELYPETKIVVFDKFRNGTKFETSGNERYLGHFKNLIGFRGDIIAGDLRNKSDLEKLKKYDFGTIFHQGAVSDTTVLDENLVIDTNLNSFYDLVEIAKEKNAKLIYASSAGTYGNSPAPNRIGEGENPENVYGFSKLMMDRVSQNSDYKNIIGLRYFNVYGERETYKMSASSMIFQLRNQVLKNGKVKLFKFGEQKRDFVYIDDVVQANLLAMKSENGGVFNVGSGEARTFNDIIKILSEEMKVNIKVEFIENPYTFYQNHTEADISETEKTLGYKPQFSLENGIKKYLKSL
jgi:ADP-L-glycero-D-manno-heptose 6-epimerase